MTTDYGIDRLNMKTYIYKNAHRAEEINLHTFVPRHILR